MCYSSLMSYEQNQDRAERLTGLLSNLTEGSPIREAIVEHERAVLETAKLRRFLYGVLPLDNAQSLHDMFHSDNSLYSSVAFVDDPEENWTLTVAFKPKKDLFKGVEGIYAENYISDFRSNILSLASTSDAELVDIKFDSLGTFELYLFNQEEGEEFVIANLLPDQHFIATDSKGNELTADTIAKINTDVEMLFGSNRITGPNSVNDW